MLCGSVFAQENDILSPIVSHLPAAVSQGESGTVTVILNIKDGYHIGDRKAGFFEIIMPRMNGISFGEISYPEGEQDEYGSYYTDGTNIEIPYHIGEKAQTGKKRISLEVSYQSCSEAGVCYPPTSVTTSFSLQIDGEEQSAANPELENNGNGLAGRLSSTLERGSILAFLIVFLGGVLTSLTPCVYPMIPITIAVIGAQAEGGKLKGFILSLFYVLGLAVTFTSLGVIAAKTGTLFGSLAQHPAALIVISLIFFLMGLSMLGVFTVQMPSSISTRLQGKRNRKGFLGAFLTGLIAGLVVSPCISPLLVVILAWVAKSGSLVMGIGLLFSFALGLGVLFILIGTFSGILKNLPKSGGWMELVERAFGLLLVALALVFLRPMLSPAVYQFAWAAGLVIFAVFAGAFDPLGGESTSLRKLGKAAGILALIVGGSLIFTGVAGFSGYVSHTFSSPAEGQEIMSAAEHSLSLEEGLEQARRSGQPLIIDFWADWCAACHELDEKTWPDPAVSRELEKFIFVKLDQTRNSREDKSMQKQYGVVGLPTVIILAPSGKELSRFTGFQPPEKIRAILAGLAKE